MDFAVDDFLRHHKTEIIRSWEASVTSEDREIGLLGSALRDDVPALLDALADWLAGNGPIEQSQATIEASKHVIQRLDAGMSLAQVFREYRLLRETIIEAVLAAETAEQERAGASGGPGRIARVKDLARLNAGLDVVLSQSVVLFVGERDRRKDEFLSMLSHELRNPLAPIRNSTYILEHASSGSEQAHRAQAVIQRQTEHLTRLVDDLLDVTRITRGKIELRRSSVDLREVVVRAAEDFRLPMDDHGVSFDTTLPEDGPVWANVDATRLTQAIGNLLTNAAKFTRRGDAVKLSLTVANQEAVIIVSDTGAGIDPDLLPSVFEPFVQGDRTLARTQGGLGLGLALVKGMATLHGGTVTAESGGRGLGATFTLRVPLEPLIRNGGTPPASPERHNGRRRVLIVDDSRDAAESLADILRMLGHEATVVFDGASAIDAAKASRPDVVLCDIGLPGMDGYEVARALRAARNGGIQLIAVSGYAQPEDVKKAIDAGFDAHIAKPPDPKQIERLLS